MTKGAAKFSFPDLSHLLDGWFHRDYDINGFEIRDVVAAYTEATTPERRERAIKDIARFLTENPEPFLQEKFEHILHPDIIVEGWDGMTTREWLAYVAQLLSDSLPKSELQ